MLGGIVALLSACDGGGSGGPVASTPPPPVYTTLAATSEAFAVSAARLNYDRIGGASTRTCSTSTPTPEFSYDTATQTYSVRGVAVSGSTKPIQQDFGPADLVAGSPGQYDKTTGANGDTIIDRLTVAPAGITLTYAALGHWTTGATSANGDQSFADFYFSYVVRTTPGDAPTTGTIDSTRAGFTSTIAGNGFSGTASGLFYGPQAAEAGGVFVINDDASGNVAAAGALIGRKN